MINNVYNNNFFIIHIQCCYYNLLNNNKQLIIFMIIHDDELLQLCPCVQLACLRYVLTSMRHAAHVAINCEHVD